MACLAALAILCFGSTGAAAQTVCPAGATLQGVDVSAAQGVVDWVQVRASGRAFAYARFSDGVGYVDPTFATNYAAIRAAGMFRGAYQFFEPAADPTAQANLLIAAIAPLGPGDLPPELDIEVTGGKASAAIVAAIQTWASVIRNALGVAPIIYTGAAFWNGSVGSTQFSAYPLFAANLGVMCPTPATGWNNWLIWQYSGNGAVPGIASSVNLDAFNGSSPLLSQFGGIPLRDTTPPQIQPTVTGTLGANGWYTSDVSVSWAVTDPESSVFQSSGCTQQTLSTDATVFSPTCRATSVGGTATQSVAVKRDATPPAIVIITPANNTAYPAGAIATAVYSCTDAASGVVPGSCSGSVANGTAIDTATSGARTFVVTAQDAAGNTATVSTTYVVSPLSLDSPGSIWTVAGNGQPGYSGDGGAGPLASLAAPLPQFLMNYPALTVPSGIAVDAHGNAYLADTGNHAVRRIDAATGVITTVAGCGAPGYNFDGVLATSACLYNPAAVALDRQGNLYIADTFNARVREVEAATGIISTIAGGGMGPGGDGGPATVAGLAAPTGIALDTTGNLFIADPAAGSVRRVDAATRTISTVAGGGMAGYSGDGGAAPAAQLNYPSGVAVDRDGTLYIADTANNRVRAVDAVSGIISTVAGTGNPGWSGDGALAASAALNAPYGVAIDAAGNLYIADAANNAVRRVDSASKIIATVVGGNSIPAFSGDGALATQAALAYPLGVAIDGAGNLLIADSRNERIRRAARVGSAVDTTPPVIAAVVAGTLSASGWYTSNVTVSWSVTDPESPIGSTTGCGPTIVSVDNVGFIVTCTATTAGGTAARSVTIKRDATPPTVNYSGNLGTYTVDQAVNISCGAADSASGVLSTTCAPVSGPAYAFNLGTNRYSASATDRAGNVGGGSATFTVAVTFQGLITLVIGFESKPAVALVMVATLRLAQAAMAAGNVAAGNKLLSLFNQQVSNQSATSLTATQADTLVRLAHSLMK